MSAPIQDLVSNAPPGVDVDESEHFALEHRRTRAPMAVAPSYRPQELVAQILSLAAQGVPVADLQVIAGMEKDISARQAAQDFNAALAAFQAECGPIKKGSTAKIATKSGGSFQYTYADLDEITRHIRPILVRHGLSYAFDSRLDKDYLTCVCTVKHINGHSVPSTFTLPTANESAMSAQQKVGAALTFAKRQSLSAGLGLTTTDEDTDAADVDPTPITEDQATVIDDLIKESGADRERFLDYIGAKSVAKIPASEYQRAVAQLKRKKAGPK